ncbi:hypothetical protein BBD42_08540 [Paenibacillus sp. BIHB 4019]|uniref:Uncharacterized protein n=1 Tax=Paenibacillus sp. BIHB 4019 TaxID=1870819 RepID=A0A1B2DFL4_9BACL|nr:hypothetical protein [Paenibacillus sp. BIHB 4019]ANY66500.1 hypothetical protein BBD42_08540 [Paenibacillus sp. BIHB 4019]
MKRSYYNLNANEQKLHKFSSIASSLLYGALFGYSLNKDIFFIWLILMLCGGIVLLQVKKWIRTELRTKMMTQIIVFTVLLDVWIVSDFIPVPMLIKQLVFLIAFCILGYKYFKLLYAGKLAVQDDAAF